MHIVTDLSSETLSYLNLVQDICKNGNAGHQSKRKHSLSEWARHPAINTPDKCSSQHKKRIGELIWSSRGDTVPVEMVEAFYKVARNLLDWLADNTKDDDNRPDLFDSMYQWRLRLRRILYESPKERIILVKTIQYMPLQIIQLIQTAEISIYQQRLYQVFMPDFTDLFSREDRECLDNFWNGSLDGQQRTELAERLLEEDGKLLHELIIKGIAVPFESFFSDELDEIQKSRDVRSAGKLQWDAPSSDQPDPFKRAADMELCGLALSGGGIRSATFNLGMLQKLANLGLIPIFDYISTVSGGGYIGSWLTAWIRQTGSIDKVTQRLDPARSPQPHAEEVRPIRWLRMFSNYLSPNASIMSDDAWALGMTWLRNIIINQVILLLMLMAVLSLFATAFEVWRWISSYKVQELGVLRVTWVSIALLLPGTLLAAAGMRTYDKEHPPQSKYNIGRSNLLAHLMVGWAACGSFLVISWFAAPKTKYYPAFWDKVSVLWPAGLLAFICMLILAFRGRYYSSVKNSQSSTWPYLTAMGFSSLCSAAVLVTLLSVSWQMVEYLMAHGDIFWLKPTELGRSVTLLITGIPLIMEVMSVCVVVRMVLMGKLFPDQRREWWARMGGYTHRFAFLWLLISSAVFLIPGLFGYVRPAVATAITSACGGSAAIVGLAVRYAFSSKSSGEKKQTGSGRAKELLIAIAPYLFMLLFLLLGSALFDKLKEWLHIPQYPVNRIDWQIVALTVALGLLTWFLGWRVGVNEFSMHHFYKNRLVRAYLGAARRRTDRENTANTFTGFDKSDDFPLAELVTGHGYFGPYPLINTALNASIVYELDRQDRKAESFIFSPRFCGFDFSPVRSAAYTRNRIYDYAYRPTDSFSAIGGPYAGTAMAVSGAAVNPNMGYHSNPAVAFLLTVFNVRLGWWIGNPLQHCWRRSDPKTGIVYLVKDLVGKSDISTDYVCLSDGGHFDNMGLYELVRRGCRYIIIGDAEEDGDTSCEGLANAIRRCYIDFGVTIEIDISSLTEKDLQTGLVKTQVATGHIIYPGREEHGMLIYVKSGLTENTPVDIREYAMTHTEFPEQSTADQFFDENQFEAYRKLGYLALGDKLDELKIKFKGGKLVFLDD